MGFVQSDTELKFSFNVINYSNHDKVEPPLPPPPKLPPTINSLPMEVCIIKFGKARKFCRESSKSLRRSVLQKRDLFLDFNSRSEIFDRIGLETCGIGLSEISRRLHVPTTVGEVYAQLHGFLQQGLQRENHPICQHNSHLPRNFGQHGKL